MEVDEEMIVFSIRADVFDQLLAIAAIVDITK